MRNNYEKCLSTWDKIIADLPTNFDTLPQSDKEQIVRGLKHKHNDPHRIIQHQCWLCEEHFNGECFDCPIYKKYPEHIACLHPDINYLIEPIKFYALLKEILS